MPPKKNPKLAKAAKDKAAKAAASSSAVEGGKVKEETYRQLTKGNRRGREGGAWTTRRAMRGDAVRGVDAAVGECAHCRAVRRALAAAAAAAACPAGTPHHDVRSHCAPAESNRRSTHNGAPCEAAHRARTMRTP